MKVIEIDGSKFNNVFCNLFPILLVLKGDDWRKKLEKWAEENKVETIIWRRPVEPNLLGDGETYCEFYAVLEGEPDRGIE